MANTFAGLRADADPARRARVTRIVKALTLITRLVEARQRRGITQVDVAEAMGVTQSGVSRLEGQDNWKLSTLLEYADAIGVDLTFDVEVDADG